MVEAALSVYTRQYYCTNVFCAIINCGYDFNEKYEELTLSGTYDTSGNSVRAPIARSAMHLLSCGQDTYLDVESGAFTSDKLG